MNVVPQIDTGSEKRPEPAEPYFKRTTDDGQSGRGRGGSGEERLKCSGEEAKKKKKKVVGRKSAATASMLPCSWSGRGEGRASPTHRWER